MAFKYINPGIADLFDEVSTNIEQCKEREYSRTSGDCFRIKDTSVNTLYVENNNEYWVSFFYYPTQMLYAVPAALIKVQNSSYSVALTHCYASNSGFYFQLRDNSNAVFGGNVDLGMYYGKGYHIELYVKDNNTNGVINLWIDGQLIYVFNGKTGEGNGFDKVAISSGGSGFVAYFSDLVIQNTGRIGDLRVDTIKADFSKTIYEWDKISVPIGNGLLNHDSLVTANKTYILSKNQFNVPGVINKIIMQVSNSFYISFFLFRKNTVTGKYNYVSVSSEYNVSVTGEYTLNLSEPIRVEANDYLGFYITKSGLLEMSGKLVHYFNDNTTSANEVDFPTSTYKYAPCLFVMFQPDVVLEGIPLLNEARQNGIEVDKYAECEVSAADKKILLALNAVDMKIGNIDSVAIINTARYEGQSPVTGISPVIKVADNTYIGDRQQLQTADKNKIVGLYTQNPHTNAAWKQSDFSDLKIGINSKV